MTPHLSSRDSFHSAKVPLGYALLMVVIAGISAQIAGAFVSGELRLLLDAQGALANGSAVIVPTMIASSGMLIAVSLIAPRLVGVSARRALALHSAPPLCFIAAAIGTVMLGPLADTVMTEMQKLFPNASLGVIPFLHDLVRKLPLIAAWPALALLPGISEELVFRGLLQRAAGGRGWFAIGLSAVCFAAFHVDPHHVVGVLPLGFFLAWVASRCGTLVTVFAHVFNNSVAIVTVQGDVLDVGYGTGTPMPLAWLPPSLAIVAVAAWLIVRETRPRPGWARTRRDMV